MSLSFHAALVAGAVGLMGCTTHLPPRQAPAGGASVLPPDTPIQPGHGRVYLDTEDGPAVVQELYSGGMGARYICQTPCYTDLILGQHTLQFRSISDYRMVERVAYQVVERKRIQGYRRALGMHDGKVGHKIVGGVLLYTGIPVLLAGIITYAVISAINEGDEFSDTSYVAGHVVTGIGVGLIGGGIGFLVSGKTVTQQGAGTHWTF